MFHPGLEGGAHFRRETCWNYQISCDDLGKCLAFWSPETVDPIYSFSAVFSGWVTCSSGYIGLVICNVTYVAGRNQWDNVVCRVFCRCHCFHTTILDLIFVCLSMHICALGSGCYERSILIYTIYFMEVLQITNDFRGVETMQICCSNLSCRLAMSPQLNWMRGFYSPCIESSLKDRSEAKSHQATENPCLKILEYNWSHPWFIKVAYVAYI